MECRKCCSKRFSNGVRENAASQALGRSAVVDRTWQLVDQKEGARCLVEHGAGGKRMHVLSDPLAHSYHCILMCCQNNRGVLQSVAECLTQAHCDKLETLCDTFETQNDMLETMCDIRQYPMRKTGQDRSGRKSTAPSSAGAKGKRTSSVGLGRGSSHSAGLSASGAGGEPPDEDQKEIPREHYLDDVSSSRRSRQRKKERRRSISSSRSPSRSPSRSRSRSRSHERRHHRSKHSHRDSRRDSHSRSRSRVRRPSASASSAPKPRGKKAKSPAPTEYFREEVKPSVRDIVTGSHFVYSFSSVVYFCVVCFVQLCRVERTWR